MSSRAWPIIKREFMEVARTKLFIIGTLLGPILIVSLVVLPMVFMRAAGGGERSVLILDATGTGIGQLAAAALTEPNPPGAGELGIAVQYEAEAREVTGDAAEERAAARERVAEDESTLDGYLYLPPGFVDGEQGIYEGRNATSVTQMAQLEGIVARVVRSYRLDQAGIEEAVARRAMAGVRIERRKPGGDEGEGTAAEASMALGYFMVLMVYFAVVLFSTAVMRGVLEEKKDKIVEVLMSSVKAQQFMVGKVIGIGGASLLQMLVWVGFGALALHYAPEIAARFNSVAPNLPNIPLSVGLAFVFFFATGFMLYAAMFGAAGAIATNDQEANQLQFPVTIPLLIGMFMAYSVVVNADSAMAVAGTLIPFTAPIVIPFRSVMTDIPMAQYVLSAVIMIITVVAVLWAAAKIYRIGVLSTGKKPTMRELVRWLRTA